MSLFSTVNSFVATVTPSALNVAVYVIGEYTALITTFSVPSV